MSEAVSIRPLLTVENSVINLVLDVFHKCVASEFSDEGVSEFKQFVSSEALSRRLNEISFAFIAEIENHPVGIIEIKDNNHVAMLFVDYRYHKRGIAGRLFSIAREKCIADNSSFKGMTVNSSLGAVQAYERLGFLQIGSEQNFHGIRFIPMEMAL
ncbi:GNAT family N-acetyltransferase [Maridesulfovibrio bastinii]|uniref:GNAT family N-acetyltransferase n=1 Tax=Maridesulfovibrio bastinii TaxID=47157 RepID=UPI0004094351|nr:GNAT family N-acetyltransferase [Maridesulfovibrio bastinii]